MSKWKLPYLIVRKDEWQSLQTENTALCGEVIACKSAIVQVMQRTSKILVTVFLIGLTIGLVTSLILLIATRKRNG